jgi:hypothetical protein
MDNQSEPNWNSAMDETPQYEGPAAAAASVVALDGDVYANGGGSDITSDNEEVVGLTMDNPSEPNDLVALYDAISANGRGSAITSDKEEAVEVLDLKDLIKTLGAEPFPVGLVYESFDALKGEVHSFATCDCFTEVQLWRETQRFSSYRYITKKGGKLLIGSMLNVHSK